MSIQNQSLASAAHHLSEAALQQLQAVLREERVAQAARLERFSPEGPAAAEMDRTALDAEIASATEALEDIDDALARIDAGSYGLCSGCRAEISFERLEAVPRARQCVSCQSRSTSLLG